METTAWSQGCASQTFEGCRLQWLSTERRVLSSRPCYNSWPDFLKIVWEDFAFSLQSRLFSYYPEGLRSARAPKSRLRLSDFRGRRLQWFVDALGEWPSGKIYKSWPLLLECLGGRGQVVEIISSWPLANLLFDFFMSLFECKKIEGILVRSMCWCVSGLFNVWVDWLAACAANC